MEFLGQNLEELVKEIGGKFSMQTTLQIADQIVINFKLIYFKFRRIEYMHTHNYIHRDIKPENFTIGY